MYSLIFHIFLCHSQLHYDVSAGLVSPAVDYA